MMANAMTASPEKKNTVRLRGHGERGCAPFTERTVARYHQLAAPAKMRNRGSNSQRVSSSERPGFGASTPWASAAEGASAAMAAAIAAKAPARRLTAFFIGRSVSCGRPASDGSHRFRRAPDKR
jgi:hypothetical protein